MDARTVALRVMALPILLLALIIGIEIINSQNPRLPQRPVNSAAPAEQQAQNTPVLGRSWSVSYAPGTKRDAADFTFRSRLTRMTAKVYKHLPKTVEPLIEISVETELEDSAQNYAVGYSKDRKAWKIVFDYDDVTDQEIGRALAVAVASESNPLAPPALVKGLAEYSIDPENELAVEILQRPDVVPMDKVLASMGWLAVAYEHEIRGTPVPEIALGKTELWVPWRDESGAIPKDSGEMLARLEDVLKKRGKQK